MAHNLSIDKQYKKWIIELKDKIRTTRNLYNNNVNNCILLLYKFERRNDRESIHREE